MSTSESPLNSDSPGDPGNHVEQTRSVADIQTAKRLHREAIVEICRSARDTQERIQRVVVDMSAPSTKTFVAMIGGNVVGFYQYRKCGTTFRMRSIRQLGGRVGSVFKDMVSHFKDQILGKSCNSTCVAHIPKQNDVLIAVFKSMGFEDTHQRDPGNVVVGYRIKFGRNRILGYMKEWMTEDLLRRIG